MKQISLPLCAQQYAKHHPRIRRFHEKRRQKTQLPTQLHQEMTHIMLTYMMRVRQAPYIAPPTQYLPSKIIDEQKGVEMLFEAS
jgi:hypothetical protein